MPQFLRRLLWELGLREDSAPEYFGHKIIWPSDRRYKWWTCEYTGEGYFKVKEPILVYEYPFAIWHGGAYLHDTRLTWKNATEEQKANHYNSLHSRF